MKKANRKRREKRKCRLKIIKRRKKKKKGKEERKKKKRKRKRVEERKKRKNGILEEWKAAAKWRGKEVARRHREMREGVWASPPGKVLARFFGNNRQQVKAAARIFVFYKTLFLLSGISAYCK